MSRPGRDLIRGYRRHKNEMELINNNYTQSGLTRQSRIDREKDRWSEELYEGMLDYKEKHGSRKLSRK